MQTGFRLEDELIEKVDELKDAEHRTRSNMVEVLLYEALAARLPKWKPKASAK